MVSEVYARDGEKIGEFYREEVRLLVPFEDFPPMLIKAFLAAEDGSFFEHNGFNYYGILRAIWVNVTSGKRKQGASTITQQAARTVSLTLKKTFTRKLREALMTIKMEKNLSKEDILYLYLNQIYLGHGSYGIGAAAETYFRKEVKDLTLGEMSLIAGLPTSPERLNPIRHSERAKVRQTYVLKRMIEEGFINEEEAEATRNEIITVHTKKKYKQAGPYYVEMVRQILVEELGEDKVLEEGLQITTSMDFKAQEKAQETLEDGLRVADKKRGYKGPKKHIDLNDTIAVEEFLLTSRNSMVKKTTETLQVQADGTTKELGEFTEFHETNSSGKIINNIPPYVKRGEIIEGLVTKIDDRKKVAYIKFAEGLGVIPLEDMKWARDHNPNVFAGDWLHIKKISKVLKPGDVIDIKVVRKVYKPKGYEKYAQLSLEQEPDLEGALLSFDVETKDIIAMVGGYNYRRSKYNRAIQAQRQTGSGFKPLVYAAGLEKGLTQGTPIMGAPLVLGGQPVQQSEATDTDQEKIDESAAVWKPRNYNGKFTGDVLMRTALKKSLNPPTVRILQKTTVPFAAEYARRLGIFSPLNMDLSMALGTSGVTVYEINKAFSVFANKGKRFTPILIKEVKSSAGEVILENISLDHRFQNQLEAIEQEFEQKRSEYQQALTNYRSKSWKQPISDDEGEEAKPAEPPTNAFYFKNPDQLISSKTAYLITNMMQAVVSEPGGTGGKAGAINRPTAGKTGTTNNYFDGWFIGYTPQVSTTVWVGYDSERTIGRGLAGGTLAIPIWLPYMKYVHEKKPVRSFDVPPGIIFASVNKDTGKATEDPEMRIKIPFAEGTEPGNAPVSEDEKRVDEKSFLKDNF